MGWEHQSLWWRGKKKQRRLLKGHEGPGASAQLQQRGTRRANALRWCLGLVTSHMAFELGAEAKALPILLTPVRLSPCL